MQNYTDLNVSRCTDYNFMTVECNLSIKYGSKLI